MAYLCCVQGMSYEQALKLLKERRPGATPLPNLERTIDKVRTLRQASPTRAEGHSHEQRASGQSADGPANTGRR
jgi:hypothetical protein